MLENFGEIEIELADKEHLETAGFDRYPLQRNNETIYWNKVRLALPRVKQIERASSLHVSLTAVVYPRKRYCNY